MGRTARRGPAPGPATSPDSGAPAEIPDRILAAAQECYRRLGLAKTTMADVARQAGLSRPTIYRYFATRDALVAAVVVQRMRALVDDARAFVDTRTGAQDRLVDGLLHLVRASRADPVTALLFDPRSVESTGGLEDAFGRVMELTTALWVPVFERARADGELNPGLDVDALCRWFATVTLITAQRMQRGEGTEDTKDTDAPLRATLVRFVMPALRRGAPTEPR